jgi:radical SAM/Cys-rich protein
MVSFAQTLKQHDLRLTRGETTTLQINMGLVCNQACKHCHLECGPHKTESMSRQTARQVVDYAAQCGFQSIDITGGAPELNPNTPWLLSKVSSLASKVMFRANLTALTDGEHDDLIAQLADSGVVIMASFPALSPGQTDSVRGKGVYDRAVKALAILNKAGFGKEGASLELNLITNPAGAFLPPDQQKSEQRFKKELLRKHGIYFNNLYSFANVPLGRFRDWLSEKALLDEYLGRLATAFNPCALDQVMCRNQVSVNWDGYLYDCDFHLAVDKPLAGKKTHVTHLSQPPEPGSPIPLLDHCYTCTAGAGFT